MSRPFMPFYSGDWMRDTAHLDDTQERAYFRLVMFYWDRGALPTDEKQLARIAHLTPAKWSKNREILASFFDENWKHKRIEKEIEKSEKFIEKQRLNGAKPKAKKMPDGEPEENPRARIPQPQPLEAVSSLRSETAQPREEDETASHSNELDRLTAKCANALGRAAPADFVIGPMAMLVNAFGESAVLKTLASEARRPRRKPIRTWQLWADIVREQLENAPKPIPPPAPGEEPIRYYAGQTMPANRLEIAIRRWTVDPSGWISAWGPTPPNNPELVKFAAERGISLQREDAA